MSNNTTQFIPLESTEGKVRLAIYVTSLVMGTIGCSIVMIVLLTKKGSKWTDHHYLLANLAVADMITIWFYVGVHFTLLSGHLANSFCKHVWPILSVPLSTSIFTITSMAMIRYRRIVRIWNYDIKPTAMVIWVVCLWIASFALLTPAIIVSRSAGRFCYLNWSHSFQRKIYIFALFLFQYLLPIIIIAAAYIGIAHNLKHYEGQVERENVRKENRDIIITLSIIAIIFTLFLMPLQIGSVLFEFGDLSTKKFVFKFMDYSDTLVLVHCCLNPFVYGIAPREFRERYSGWSSRVLRTISKASLWENTTYKISNLNESEQGRNRRCTNQSLEHKLSLEVAGKV